MAEGVDNQPRAAEHVTPMTPARPKRKEIYRATKEVIHTTGWLILLGAIIGLMLVIVGSHLSPPGKVDTGYGMFTHVVGSLFQEIGTAFLVAALTIFSFDLVGHLSGFLHKEEALNHKEDTLNRQIEELTKVGRVVERSQDPLAALKNDLRGMYGHDALAESLFQPMDHARNIVLRSQNRRPDIEPYLAFMSTLLNRTVLPIAAAVDGFHNNVVRREIFHEQSYVLPDSRRVAGDVLTMLLKCLGDKDCYRSVSNILFYENDLMAVFEEAALDACNNRYVTIRRLFNVTNFEKTPPDDDTLVTIKTIIEAHRNLARRIAHGRYEFRFVGAKIWKSTKEKVPFDPFTHDHLRDAEGSFFGLFCHERDKSALLFSSEERASRVHLAYCDERQERTKAFFDEMWRQAGLSDSAPAWTSP